MLRRLRLLLSSSKIFFDNDVRNGRAGRADYTIDAQYL